MKTNLKKAYVREMKQAKLLYQNKNYDACFYHLERAHILGQSHILPHTLSHWWMLKVGWKTRDVKEVVGQIPRIFFSIVLSKVWVPLGNTGGTNVSPLKPMPVPEELKQYLHL